MYVCIISWHFGILLQRPLSKEREGTLKNSNILSILERVKIDILTHLANRANGKKVVFYSATIHCVTLSGVVLWCHFPIYHVSLTLDDVTSFLCVINVRNKCKLLRYSQTFGGISSVQWRNVWRIWRMQLLLHRFLCVRIEIISFCAWIDE